MRSLALNQSTCKNKDIIKFIKISKDFQGIELGFEQLDSSLSEELSLKDIFEYFSIYDLRLINLFQLEDFSLCSDTKFKTVIIPILKKMMNYCYKLECNMLSVIPSFESRNIPQWKILRRTIEKLEEIAKIAYKEGIRIGFEVVNLPNSSIPTLKEAKKVLNPLKSQENLGYIVDTFYLGKGDEDPEDLLEIMDYIYLIRLADLFKKDQEITKAIEEEQRLLPGKGSFNFKKFFPITKRYYKNYFSLKLSEKSCQQTLYKKFFRTINYFKWII
jgi:sugar phosphate isomerase/epimerase